MDPRIKRLSELLTGYSCRLQPGEKVLIDYEGEETKPLVRQLIKDAYKLGAKPYVNHRDSAVLREILLGADEEQIAFLDDYLLYQMRAWMPTSPSAAERTFPSFQMYHLKN